jgi:hypothetical protein
VKFKITRNPVKEPHLNCRVMRILVPYALLIDAAIEIFTLSQFSGNLQMTLIVKLAKEREKLAEQSRKLHNI